MKVAVVGTGGREHALCFKVAKSPLCEKVFALPGNAGMAYNNPSDKIACINDEFKTAQQVYNFVVKEKIELVIIGPEAPLAEGMSDELRMKGVTVFAPSKAAATLETSKIFSKNIMRDIEIPTADFRVCQNLEEALTAIETSDWEGGIVIKEDGLCAGKGVSVFKDINEATKFLETYTFNGPLLLESMLKGREVSFFTLCAGDKFLHLGHACDYKRIRDNDEGPNTGGMGAYTPSEWVTPEFEKKAYEQVIAPLLAEMKKRGTPYEGILFSGFMSEGEIPYVLEFNARFGDPEAQTLIPLIEDDLLPIFYSVAKEGRIDTNKINIKDQASIYIVLASYGYPGTEGISVRKGDSITIDRDKLKENNITPFFAGVKQDGARLMTNGGRVMGLNLIGDKKDEVKSELYKNLAAVKFEGMQYRTDIGN